MDAARCMSGHGLTAPKGAHGKGAGLVELRARWQREPRHWSSEQMCMVWYENEQGPPFYKVVGQLKGPGATEKPHNEFRHYCKIHSCSNFQPAEKHEILIKKIKIKINK